MANKTLGRLASAASASPSARPASTHAATAATQADFLLELMVTAPFSRLGEGVRGFEPLEIPVGNGLCAVPRNRLSRRNATEGVPYGLEFPDTLS
jgi:hypothetical protein